MAEELLKSGYPSLLRPHEKSCEGRLGSLMGEPFSCELKEEAEGNPYILARELMGRSVGKPSIFWEEEEELGSIGSMLMRSCKMAASSWLRAVGLEQLVWVKREGFVL